MAGAWISAWSATSLSRVPAYPFLLSTCAAASRIRSLVRADFVAASSGAAASCFLGTRQIIGCRPLTARSATSVSGRYSQRRRPCLVVPLLTPVAALGRLPLLDQPGTRWRYNTGATVAGVLIER